MRNAAIHSRAGGPQAVAAAVAMAALLTISCAPSGDPPADPAASSAATSATRVDGDTRPDIVLISIDSLRADHVGAYGYPPPTSPTLDRLAREGVLFETAVSTTSWTLPAHAAMFTGLFDTAHGVIRDGARLAEEHLTLAERLQAAGYSTAGFFGGPYLHPGYGLAQGFEHYESCMAPTTMDGNGDHHLASHQDITGPRTVDRVQAWVASPGGANPGPRFVFIHLWDVHYDYNAPADVLALFDADYDGPVSGQDFMDDPAISAEMAPRDFQHLLALYDAEIRFTDGIVEQLLSSLGRADREQLVMVTADHGEEFFEHGRKGHRYSLYEEVVRVPLIVHWPGRIDAGSRVSQQVRLVDLLPTLAAAAGDETVAVQGRDLTPLLTGGELPPAPALMELFFSDTWLRGVRNDSNKVISAGTHHFQYFDLANDPAEARPQPIQSDEQRRVARQLFAVVKESDGIAKGFRHRAAEVPEDVRRRLESLGYIDGDGGQP